MRTITSRSAVCSFLLLLTTQLQAQDLDTVTIRGQVSDQTGAVIPDATVTTTLSGTGRERTIETDAQGRFRFIQLAPGNYSITASSAGFANQERKNVVLISGQNVQFDFVLYPEILSVDPILVTAADSPLVDTTRTVVGGTLQPYEVESLPIATRSTLDLIFMLPGITEEPLSIRELAEDRNASHATTPEEAGIFALAGGPAYSNNLTIDGLDNNDDRAARERFEPSLESVQELQVITNQFAAEYGRASGGRINLRTRSGSAQLHGRGYYFFKDESLNANTFRNNSRGLKRLPLQEHNPGFNLGGPVVLPLVRRKLPAFFFVSYEFDKVLDHAVIDTLVPVQHTTVFPLPAPTTLLGRRLEDASPPSLNAEVAPFVSSVATPLRNHRVLARWDHQFRNTHTGTFLLQLGRLTNLRQFGGGNRLAEGLQEHSRNSDSFSYSDDLVLSSTKIIQTRFQYSCLQPALKTRASASQVVLITLNDPLAASDAAQRSGTLVAGNSSAGGTDRSETRFQAQNTFSLLSGGHSFKFGFDVQKIKSTYIDLTDSSGTFTFSSAGDFLAAAPSRFRQNFLTESTQRNTYLGFFIQDEWRISGTTVVSYGLRYERETIVKDTNNFGPRISVAYDPLNSGKTVIRLGAGIFYNRALLRTIDDFTLGTNRLFFDTNTIRDAATGKLLTNDERRAFIAANLKFPNTLNVDAPLVMRYAVRDSEFSRRLDPALRIAESYQANVGFERDLGHGFVFETNATFNRGIHLWREFNANAPVLPTAYKNFSDYLLSRDFANFRSGPSAFRPLYNAANAGELIRFSSTTADAANPSAIAHIMEFGVPVTLVNLNSISSNAAVEIALAAINELRPDPMQREVEQLIAAGNSFYRGMTIEVRRTYVAKPGLNVAFRAAYTISSLVDDGIVNTSDALSPGDFRAERARSLLDRRHRFVFSGTFDLPAALGKLRLAPAWRVASGAPFNISLGGVDRNLDDVGNDRPIFTGDKNKLRWRGPGDSLNVQLLNHFAAPTIGQSGNLRRNAGVGPGLFLLDLNVTREFQINEKIRVRPTIEFDNVLNKTVFSFGSEFINFTALSPAATAEQRQALLDSFLLATRTLRQRQIRLGIRLDF